MRIVLTALLLAVIAGGAADARTPQAPPKPGASAQGQKANETIPADEVAARPQLVNIKVDIVVIEEGGEEPTTRKEMTLLLADRLEGVVRSSAQGTGADKRERQVSAGVRPWLRPNGMIQTQVSLNYTSHPHFTNWGQLRFEPLLENGKPLLVAQTTSAISDRRVRVEVTATVLK